MNEVIEKGRGTWARPWGIVSALVVAAALIVSAVVLRHPASAASPATVTVTGTGTAKGAPDTLSFQIGVNSTAATASAALEENNSRVGALESSLIANGITRKDMQTSDLNISTNTNNYGVVTGFTVSDVLSVTTHRLASAGRTLDAAVHVAGNGAQLYGVSFSLSHQSRVLAAARADAMKNARAAAGQYASAGGASVGRVLKISEQVTSTPLPYTLTDGGFAAAKASVPLQSGTASVSALVTVVYALNG
ncbi:MAG TPA: SIMPL domain-containing protein [Acidimicrobiales bacterium]|nr:SIMPL domain-containing protein [Acidimicrobiales bacterium]